MARLVECVPNFSEGRDRAVIDAIAEAIRASPASSCSTWIRARTPTARSSPSSARPSAVEEAALAAQQGLRADRHVQAPRRASAHGRHGRLPLRAGLRRDHGGVRRDRPRLGRALGDELEVPVYLYERRPPRRTAEPGRPSAPASTRGSSEKLKDPDWAPDFGPAEFNPKSGATVVGAREFLIAYNVNLNTRDQKLANEIALSIREDGAPEARRGRQAVVDAQGKRSTSRASSRRCGPSAGTSRSTAGPRSPST